MDDTTDTPSRDRAAARGPHPVLALAVIAAALPYVGLKLLWLSGSSVGSATAAGAASLHDPRHTVGNLATLAMELVAVLLALALVDRRGRRLPAAAVLVPLWVGGGLLAPIALGLPFGLLAQGFSGGSPAPADNGLHGWVYAVVYGGFLVQALALGSAFVFHARARWPVAFERRARQIVGTGGWARALAFAGALAGAVYGAAQLAWAFAGGRLGAPPGFETLAQRSVFVSTAVLVLAGAWGVLALFDRAPKSQRLLPPVATAWLGSATAFASAIAAYALHGTTSPGPPTLLLLALGAVAGLALGGALLRALTSPRRKRTGSRPPRSELTSSRPAAS